MSNLRLVVNNQRSINPSFGHRFRGCLLGAAAGDALGAPLEAMTREKILRSFGSEVDRFVYNPLKPQLEPGQWTDDTALTLATARSITNLGKIDIEDITFNLKMAYETEPFRGYGLSTRQAFSGQQKRYHRPSNGAAMRIAPVALFSTNELTALRDNVDRVSRITHLSPDSVDGAQAVAFAIVLAATGSLQPDQLIGDTVSYLGQTTNMAYKLKEAAELLQAKVEPTEGFEQLGVSGNVLETVGSAFFAFLRSPQMFRESVVTAVNAGGDTDTIGSITGALSGAFNGFSAIPSRWVNNLEARTEIDELSASLYHLASLNP